MDWNSILLKALSGRLWLTIICGGVFAYLSIEKILDPKDSLCVILIVMNAYFTRDRSSDMPVQK